MKQWSIQKAIYKVLTEDLDLMERITGVFDDVPQVATFPYVVIGEDTSIEWDTDDGIGVNSTLTVHIWSRENGRKEVKDIMNLVYNVLHRADLQADDLFVVDCSIEFQESFMDSDGITRHGVMRARLIIEGGFYGS